MTRTQAALAFVTLCLATPVTAQGDAQLLRVTSGPSGSEVNGTFRIDEVRARFDPSVDKQVFVFFEWQGTHGAHRIAVTWRSPDGGMSSTTGVDYVAKAARFGAYFSMPLRGDLPPGTWSAEATLDGQPAGRYTFELVPNAMRGTLPSGATAKRPLTQAEVYAQLDKLFVVIQRHRAAGRPLEDAAGYVGPFGVLTAVAAIDATDGVNAVFPDHTTRPISAVVGIDRGEGWAVLANTPTSTERLAIAATPAIGNQVFSMQQATGGSRIVVAGEISGRSETDAAHGRWLVRWGGGMIAPGAPVLNEFGELIGTAGGGPASGASDDQILDYETRILAAPVIPASMVRVTPGVPPVTFEQLRAAGTLLSALHGSENLLDGGFCRSVSKSGASTRPVDQRTEFSPSEGAFVAFVTWSPQSRVKGVLTFRFANDGGHTVAESAPKKIDYRPGILAMSTWNLPIPHEPGWYYAEALVNGAPAYRMFVQVR
jgi:hypothetical protein